MPRGAKPGQRFGGRQKGKPNRRTEARQALIEHVGEIAQTQTAEMLVRFDPVFALQSVSLWAHDRWREAVEANRIDEAREWAEQLVRFAKEAAPYLRPRLAAVEARVDVNVSLFERIERAQQRIKNLA